MSIVMKTVLSTFFLCFLFTLSVCAQTGGRIAGQVKESDNKASSGVSASLYKAKDSTLAKVAVTDKNGQFEFVGIKAGQYYIVFTSVGFEKKATADLDVAENATVQVPVIS